MQKSQCTKKKRLAKAGPYVPWDGRDSRDKSDGILRDTQLSNLNLQRLAL